MVFRSVHKSISSITQALVHCVIFITDETANFDVLFLTKVESINAGGAMMVAASSPTGAETMINHENSAQVDEFGVVMKILRYKFTGIWTFHVSGYCITGSPIDMEINWRRPSCLSLALSDR